MILNGADNHVCPTGNHGESEVKLVRLQEICLHINRGACSAHELRLRPDINHSPLS
jgi:hypothetical protein